VTGAIGVEPVWVEALRSDCRGGRVGDPLRFAPSLPSTNDAARDWLAAGGLSGLVVIAGEQTAGRGRRGRAWDSPPGTGLYLSAGLALPQALAPFLTFLGAIAVAEALLRQGIPAEICWPNDVEVGGRKIAGVLAETRVDGGPRIHGVVGVGLNVSQREADFPEPLAGRATSVRLAGDGAAAVGPWAARLLTELGRLLGDLEATGGAPLLDRWRALSPSQRGAAVMIEGDGESFTGVTRGVDDEGALRIERADGRVTLVRVGELRRARRT
jgi:BirA family biotin operon repressor/biotin-[acetyl-CoA-carboxylase] ligase